MHYNEALWIDFVRGIVNEDLAREMQQHLQGGCHRCHALHTSLAAVEESFAEDRSWPVPEALVAKARTIFPAQRHFWRDLPREIAALIVDGVGQPALAGVRSSIDAARHYSFQAQNYRVEVQVERQAQPVAHLLTGQLIADDGAGDVRGVPVLVFNDETEVARQLTNEFGEFHLDLPALRKARLVLLVEEQTRAIELLLG